MGKHAPVCWVMTALVAIGGLNWLLMGLGGLIGRDLNVLHMILGGLPILEYIVYILAGASIVFYAAMGAKAKDCGCQKQNK